MNNRAKVLSVTHFVLALVWLVGSLHFLTSAVSYDRHGFTSPALIYDLEQDQYIAINLKTPLIILYTVIFALGWLCEGFAEKLLLQNNQKIAIAIFAVPTLLAVLFIVGMTRFPFGFLSSALSACGFGVVSGFYLRYSIIAPEALEKFYGRNR